MPSSAALVVFATATAGKAVLDIKQAKKVERAEELRQRVDVASQQEDASRRRRATVKEALIKRAQIENVAGATGQTDSSAVVAGTSQVTGDLAENIGNINTGTAFASASTAAQGRVNRARTSSPLQIGLGAVQQGSSIFIR